MRSHTFNRTNTGAKRCVAVLCVVFCEVRRFSGSQLPPGVSLQEVGCSTDKLHRTHRNARSHTHTNKGTHARTHTHTHTHTHGERERETQQVSHSRPAIHPPTYPLARPSTHTTQTHTRIHRHMQPLTQEDTCQHAPAQKIAHAQTPMINFFYNLLIDSDPTPPLTHKPTQKRATKHNTHTLAHTHTHTHTQLHAKTRIAKLVSRVYQSFIPLFTLT